MNQENLWRRYWKWVISILLILAIVAADRLGLGSQMGLREIISENMKLDYCEYLKPAFRDLFQSALFGMVFLCTALHV